MSRRKAKHPEQIEKERIARAEARASKHKGWAPDYGWLVIFYADDRRVKRHSPPGTTAKEVREFVQAEMKVNPRYEKAWCIKKTGVTS